MFMSRLRIDPRRTRPGDLYDSHQALWRLFGDHADRERDFLYRELDPLDFLTVSRRAPADADDMWGIHVKEYAPKLREGDVLRFSLRANAVIKRKSPEGRQVRYDVVQDARMRFREVGKEPPPRAVLAQEAGSAWLMKRQETLGLAFEPTSLIVEGYGQHKLRRKGPQAKVATLDFSGRAQVVSPEKALQALFSGIGPAKGFGCGLLLVRRV